MSNSDPTPSIHDEVREFKRLQEKNIRLKKLVAELSPDKAILQDITTKNGPARAETQSGGVCDYHHATSKRRTCRLVGQQAPRIQPRRSRFVLTVV